jgi:hypothetical protein
MLLTKSVGSGEPNDNPFESLCYYLFKSMPLPTLSPAYNNLPTYVPILSRRYRCVCVNGRRKLSVAIMLSSL